ncbi:MAG: RNA 2'-phosphotransferase [Clostridiales bacterium]|jgi:putative RNA 2'-phosphotransferase|nr:RNA 2'-phosphotransferase [Clostridiales bacterium]
MENLTKISKLLSLILRHKPETIGIGLNENGWADVGALLKALNEKNYNVNMDLLERVVSENNKQRFIFSPDKTKIRANQGHSINIDLGLIPSPPPDILYHGTATRFLGSINTQGLLKQSRNHVHLSADIETAQKVGIRHGRPIALLINAKAMYRDGYLFYISENNVWLTEHVPAKYFI